MSDVREMLAEMIGCYGSDDGCGPIAIIERAKAALLQPCNSHDVLVNSLRSAVASLEQFVKLGRIPANNQGLRDARSALALIAK